MYPRLKRVRRGDQVHEYVQLVEGRREAGKVGQRVHSARPACGRRAPRGRPAARRRPLPAPARAGRAGRRGRADARPGAGHPRRGDRGAGGEPAPLYDVAGWAGAYAVAELLGVPAGLLNDDRLGRALDALAPVVEDVRARTLLATLERFEVEASRLHLDLTAVRFAGAYLDSALVAKGWAADRTVGRQVR